MRKKGISRKRRFLLLTAQHLMAVIAACCVAVIISNAYFVVNGMTSYYSYMLYPWDEHGEYEKSSVFNHVFDTSVNDIITMAVIKTQMETNGEFDGKKKVDIAAYVNRKSDHAQNMVSVEYYLEDLLKWYEYGFVMEEHAEEATTEEGMFQREVLQERYQPVNGGSISEYVNSWEEYDEFVDMLISASRQLSYNYDSYKQFRDSYDSDQTNLRYCLMIPKEDGRSYQYFSNVDHLPKRIEAMTAEEITAFFKEYGVYLSYYPKHMEYETNTDRSEEFVRSALNNYAYVYPEECRIWIGVDTNYPVQDGLLLGKLQYEQFMPYYYIWILGAALSLIVYFVLFILITFYEGKVEAKAESDETPEILRTVDHIPAEIMILMSVMIGLVYFFICCGSYYTYLEAHTLETMVIVLAVLALIFSVVFMFFYLSLVRRLRAHSFWKNTMVGWLCRKTIRLCRRLGGKLKQFSDRMYNDRSLVVRTWGPYLFFLGVNLVCLGCLFTNFWWLGLIGAATFDLAAGVVQFRMNQTRQQIIDGIETIQEGNLSYQIDTEGIYGDNLALANAVNSIGEGIRVAVETSMKDERLKTDLITNVSHDIKTPLTSIINYVDLIKREDIRDERIKGYIEVLDAKSQRLKQLTEDLVEASKISSGNIVYQFEQINLVELVRQTIGEFSEKFEEKQLTVVTSIPEEAVPIEADSRRIWRVVENLYNNIYKYALPGTRVYMDMKRKIGNDREYVEFSIKNISAQPLNIEADELTERFIRGDVSRSTEGSGLGLSIAKNLTEAQHGSFHIYLDGDLFKVTLTFPLCAQGKEDL